MDSPQHESLVDSSFINTTNNTSIYELENKNGHEVEFEKAVPENIELTVPETIIQEIAYAANQPPENVYAEEKCDHQISNKEIYKEFIKTNKI